MTPIPSTPVDPATATARWRELVAAELAGAAYDKKLVTRTFEGLALQPVYTRADLNGIWPHVSLPGEPPFVRGSRRPTGERPWEIAQEIAAPTPQDLNAALLAALRGGQSSVSLRPCATDWRAPWIPTLEAMGIALANVNLQAVPIHCSAGSDPSPFAALLLAHATAHGFPPNQLTGSITGDPFAEWIATGRLPVTLESRYDSVAGWTSYAAAEAPQLRTIEIDTTPWSDGGATAVQEVAITLAAGAEYFRAMLSRGLSATVIASRIRVRCAIGPQFFMEVAKFRALRGLWTQVTSAFGTNRSTPWIHAVTGRWNKSKLDTPVNLLRATTEGLSAVLGGVDSLHLAPSDETLGTLEPSAQRLARNLQILLADEFHFGRTADPAGGSWYVEKLTDDLARAAWTLFQNIERDGGLAMSLRRGRPQAQVAEIAAEKKRALATRRMALVGTNLFPNLRDKPPIVGPAPVRPREISDIPRPHPFLDGASWGERFATTLAVARSGLPVDQLTWIASSSSAREASIQTLAPSRGATSFEDLRRLAEAFRTRTGHLPRVFLACFGPVAQHQARASFSTGFFAAGGIEAIAQGTFVDAGIAARAALASGAAIAVLCSTDETYPQLVPSFAAAVKCADQPPLVVVAGQPATPELTHTYLASGVDEFIHLRSDLPATLARFLNHPRLRL